MTLMLTVKGPGAWAVAVDGLADEHTLSHIRKIIQGFAEDSDQARLYDKTISWWLAGLAGNWIRAVLSYENAVPVVPLPTDTIRAGGIRHYDPNYVAAVLLAVIAWLFTVAGPTIISKMPQADQSILAEYYSGIPGLAVAITGYLITHRPKGK